MIQLDRVYWDKAEENLAAAQSELVNGRYNSSASRAYYSCFHAAIYALIQAGIRSTSTQRPWSHEFVQAQFNGVLIDRRHLYPTSLRGTLNQNYSLRLMADYGTDRITQISADRAVRRTGRFLEAIRQV